MDERPILFSDPMVRAILEDRKVQTRRLGGLEAFNNDPGGWVCRGVSRDCHIDNKTFCGFSESWTSQKFHAKCPYGLPGDKLWVREAWQVESDTGVALERIPKKRPAHVGVIYRSSDAGARWRPSIHMPRWASRVLLEITAIRVEPLQEITDEDAQAEGVICLPGESPRDAFARLWREINGAGSWEKNPWVWVISFKVARPMSSGVGEGIPGEAGKPVMERRSINVREVNRVATGVSSSPCGVTVSAPAAKAGTRTPPLNSSDARPALPAPETETEARRG